MRKISDFEMARTKGGFGWLIIGLVVAAIVLAAHGISVDWEMK